jgi:hypothetical protein
MSIARLAGKLGVPIYRNAIAAGAIMTSSFGFVPRRKAKKFH